VLTVRNYLKTLDGFNKITLNFSDVNKGLAKSIIEGVTQVLGKYESVIVLEDDLLPDVHFLQFMNEALDFYKDDTKIQSISGFSLKLDSYENDLYFQTRPFPWGWGTWKDRWNEDIFDKKRITEQLTNNRDLLKLFDAECGDDISKMLLDSLSGKNDSWYVRWVFNHFINKSYSVFPIYSLVKNVGWNVDATHCLTINPYESVYNENYDIKFTSFAPPDENIRRSFLRYFTFRHKLIVRLKLLKNLSGIKLVWQDVITRIV
jgi:hypothetical protein